MAESLLGSLHLALSLLLIHSAVETGSVLSAFQLLRQLPPGARRIPVIASSKLRYAGTLAHMKGETEAKARAPDSEVSRLHRDC